jgi:hypothetical protein
MLLRNPSHSPKPSRRWPPNLVRATVQLVLGGAPGGPDTVLWRWGLLTDAHCSTDCRTVLQLWVFCLLPINVKSLEALNQHTGSSSLTVMKNYLIMSLLMIYWKPPARHTPSWVVHSDNFKQSSKWIQKRLCPLTVLSGACTDCMILLSWLVLLIASVSVFPLCVRAEGFSDSATALFAPGHLLPLAY